MPGYEFVIHQKSVVCASCDQVFAMPVNMTLPEMSQTLPVEADLHRVLPYGDIRACMIAICPFCHYAWWASTFEPHFTLPICIPEAPQIDEHKAFAHALLTGRRQNYHILDRAMIALNGYWCAKESHQHTDKWRALAIQELSAALNDQKWEGNRARYHYILGELMRLNGQFEAAIEQFSLVDNDANLPQDLVDQQKQLTAAHENRPVFLTKEQIKTIFFPDLLADLPKEIFDINTVVQSKDPDMSVDQDISTTTNLQSTFALPISHTLPARKNKTASGDSAWTEVKTIPVSGFSRR